MNLKEKAKKATSRKESEITKGREKMKLEELVASIGKRVTICGVDILAVKDRDTNEKRDTAAMIVIEDAKHWVFGGAALLNIINEWLTPEEGEEAPTMEDINKELASHPVAVVLEKKTQKGDSRKTYWNYDIVD